MSRTAYNRHRTTARNITAAVLATVGCAVVVTIALLLHALYGFVLEVANVLGGAA